MDLRGHEINAHRGTDNMRLQDAGAMRLWHYVVVGLQKTMRLLTPEAIERAVRTSLEYE